MYFKLDEDLTRTIELTRNIRKMVEERSISSNLENQSSTEYSLSQNLAVFNFLENMRIIRSEFLLNIDNFDFGDLEDVRQTFTEEEYSKLILENSKDNCGICLEKDCEKYIKLKKCNHVFCENCIKNWLLKYNINCPTCRKDLRSN